MKKISLTALTVALAAALVPAAGAHGPGLKEVRKATERYRDASVAVKAGYAPAKECVAGPEGGMGYHYANERLIRDPRIDPLRPEILVYAPRGKGLRLVAVEWFRADADGRLDTDDDRPYLFHRGFDGPMEGHEPGMPVHYDLHAWIFKGNPDGVFAPYNPRVSCPNS
jgi:hypothetical protein